MKSINNLSSDLTLTLCCNNNCLFCPRKDFLKYIACRSEKEIYRQIEEISKRSPRIVLTGGEVTVYPKIFEVLKFCQKRFKNIEIITNGRKLKDKNFLQKLISLGVNNFALSIYSLSHKIHDKITRRKGSCRETKQAIINLLEIGSLKDIRLRINITLNFWNKIDIIDTIKRLYVLGIRNFTISEEIVLNEKMKVLKLEEIRQILEEIFSLNLPKSQIFIKGFPFCVLSDITNSSKGRTKNFLAEIIYEPYRLESCINQDIRKKKYIKRFQDNFIKSSKCLSCIFASQCMGIQKYYPDAKLCFHPIKRKI